MGTFMEFNTAQIILFIAAYLLGSLPFGLIIAKIKGVDIRAQGSGNIGATNVTRVIGKKLGAVVLVLDLLKGALAVVIALNFGDENYIPALCAAFAVLGHIFPVWLKFKGGKGVATTLGVLLALSPIVGVAVIASWIVTYIITKISSLSALVAVALSPVFAYFIETSGLQIVYLCVFLELVIIASHHENIKRLIKGEEKKIK
jgi:glycerol-3-phosphate acyltransferase PlsY